MLSDLFLIAVGRRPVKPAAAQLIGKQGLPGVMILIIMRILISDTASQFARAAVVGVPQIRRDPKTS